MEPAELPPDSMRWAPRAATAALMALFFAPAFFIASVVRDRAAQRDLHAESACVGLDPHFTPAVRYPEVPADIAAPRAR